MISYKPLLKLLVEMDMKKTDLITKVELSSSTVAKISKNDYVSLEVIDRICKALDVQPGDIIEYIPD